MLTVQIGQCGNQLGHALFDKLAVEDPSLCSNISNNNNTYASESAFFRCSARKARPVARAVLLDMEPKVIQRCQDATSATTTRPWTYARENAFTRQSGSGNNWAFGYNVHGAQTSEDVAELIQREAEHADFVRGVLTLQSAAGGTGAGLGSLVTEQIADLLPACSLVNAVVWPYASGEVIVQNYNAMLTMASLTSVADGVLVLQNDVASEICKKLLRMARPSFEHMNDVLATQLAAALLPCGQHEERRLTAHDPVGALTRHLCHHPGFKLLDLKIVPQMPQRSKQFSTHTWAGIIKHLRQMQIANSPLEEGINWNITPATSPSKTIASVLLLRGKHASQSDLSCLNQPAIYAPWNPQPFVCWTSDRVFNQYDKTAALISNSNAIVPVLRPTLEKAHQMFVHGAYLHLYRRYGVEDSFFQSSFLRIDQIIRNYESV
ncbi:TPA: hypothetical protein N0F65_007155 [Lagenidium giganteum]|uniref:Tubulin delta chain n=1 Tax=Lagenidium giganteum TaxID=4803 RepID=A0AAV2YYU1_9STRA|nr:TPA: hypothetical protein N0F65_007155 [Lagenidium giganteum]